MTDPFHPDFEPTPEELRKRQEKREGVHGRSKADDILDAVAGVEPRRLSTNCPVCGGPTKLRQPGVGAGVAVRRCRNPACRNEAQVAMRSAPGAARPYLPAEHPAARRRTGPYAGQSASPPDRTSPANRQLSEYIRQVKTNEP